MNQWIWNGKVDCDWNDLSHMLIDSSEDFTTTMLETTKFSMNEKSKELISSESMERFKNITSLLANNIKCSDENTCENGLNEAIKLNCWIVLGSITETCLQIFQAFYLDNYKDTKWQQWENFDKDNIKEKITDYIQSLVDDGFLEQGYARSLKNSIKDTIKNHTIEHQVEKIMLNELIQLYDSLDLLEEDELNSLKTIQANRNGIHSFQNRSIGSWEELKYSIRFFCYLLEWIIYHLPDIPEEEYYY